MTACDRCYHLDCPSLVGYSNDSVQNEWILTAQSYVAYRCVCPKNLSIDCFPTLLTERLNRMQWSLNAHLVFTVVVADCQVNVIPTRVFHQNRQRYRSCRFLRMTTLASHQELE